MARKAYINKHDTVVFLDDDDERLKPFLDAGYREVESEDRIVTQAAEITPVVSNQASPHFDPKFTFGKLVDAEERDEAMDISHMAGDLNPSSDEILDYIREVRTLRARNAKARTAAGLDNPPAKIVRKGKGTS